MEIHVQEEKLKKIKIKKGRKINDKIFACQEFVQIFCKMMFIDIKVNPLQWLNLMTQKGLISILKCARGYIVQITSRKYPKNGK